MHTSDARMLRGAAIPTSVAGVGAVLLGLLTVGAKGALAAALASVVVIAFFSISALVVSWAARYSAQTMMLAALASYAVKILAVMVLVTAMDGVSIWNTTVFGWTVIGLALLWIAAEFRIALQQRPYIDEPENVLDQVLMQAPRTVPAPTDYSNMTTAWVACYRPERDERAETLGRRTASENSPTSPGPCPATFSPG